ncbi:alpha/beta fold hydrolase [Actibacterium lipolyticum]|uniref:Dihydrolipoyllysine-residue acetyltransferase component of acetoin cleaving system n=1 Tax=Actibacterium lipolyticum TaxID=1524263 RepID=A0A238JMD8_9RHOB|nr:alpha/beta hydrolase [Actibacterium lipolyticum]SMX31655.1 Dihydrolipoyllysine-residue acetyltransferase component of acetoin cleaving system [Actibacterium lipolyticum]
MPVKSRGGFDTYSAQLGQGARKALLIHCSLAHSGSWAGLMGALGDTLSAEAFDLPGHGRSGDWVGDVDFQDQALAMAADFMAEEPIDLIGHSFGGTVALRLALEQPDRVRSLTLIEPVLFAAARGTPEYAENEALFAPFAEAIARGDRVAASKAFTGPWGAGAPWEALPRQLQDYIERRIHLIPAGNAALMDDRPGVLAPDRLEGLDIPVLLLEGGSSPSIVGAVNAALAARLARARRATIPGAGHMLPITHPKQVAHAIEGFLADASAPAISPG